MPLKPGMSSNGYDEDPLVVVTSFAVVVEGVVGLVVVIVDLVVVEVVLEEGWLFVVGGGAIGT